MSDRGLQFGVAVTLVLVCANGALAGGPLFPGQQYEVGNGPGCVAASDLNGDGWLDLAVANCANGTVSVLLNNSDGTFGAQVQYVVGGGPWSVAVADLDRDGWLDVAVANRDSDTVTLLLNNRDGTFAAPLRYGVGEQPYSVAIADVSGDGGLDLVVASRASNSVSVLLNQRARLLGDIDDDGDVDWLDLLALLSAYGACQGEGDYNPNADFDHNGCIALSDLAALLSVYGTTCE